MWKIVAHTLGVMTLLGGSILNRELQGKKSTSKTKYSDLDINCIKTWFEDLFKFFISSKRFLSACKVMSAENRGQGDNDPLLKYCRVSPNKH